MQDLCTKLHLLLYGILQLVKTQGWNWWCCSLPGRGELAVCSRTLGYTAPGLLRLAEESLIPWKFSNHWQRAVLGMKWEKYEEQKPCFLQPRTKIEAKADRAGEKVPAAVKETCSSSHLCFALGSFRELPHLMACQDSRKGGKGKLEKEEERGEGLGGEQCPSQIWGRPQIWGGISAIPQSMGNTAPWKAQLCSRLTLGKNTSCPEFHRSNGIWWVQISPCNLWEDIGIKVCYSAWKEPVEVKENF